MSERKLYFIIFHFHSGNFLEAVSVVIFIAMLLLMGKGFTITRGRISTGGSIKIAVFMTLYAITYAIVFFYDAYVSNQFI